MRTGDTILIQMPHAISKRHIQSDTSISLSLQCYLPANITKQKACKFAVTGYSFLRNELDVLHTVVLSCHNQIA